MKFLAPFISLVFVPTASSFVAPKLQSTTPVIGKRHGNGAFVQKTSVLHMSAVRDESDSNDVFSKIPDLSMETLDIVKVRENIMDGEFGTRGETFAAAQFALLLCIVGGGIPFIGDFLMVLLGPGLLLAGAGTLFLSVKDLGNNLSPWVNPPSGGELVTDGIYAQLRHPLYAGILAAMAGFSIITGSASRLLLTGILVYVFNVMADKEEAALTEEHSEYIAYKQDVTGRFFPDKILQLLPWNAED